MVKPFYEEMQAVASDVLREFDQGGVYYVALEPGDGPVDNPGTPTPVPYKIDAAVRGVKFKYINGTTIFAGDLQCVMAVRADVTPDASGFVDVGGVRYKMREVQPIPAAGTPVAYRLVFGK